MKKSEIIYPELKKLIDRLPPGTKIPSVRTLMKRFRVSQATIDQAMSAIKDEGLIVTYHGDGSYTLGDRLEKIATREFSAKPLVGLAVPDYPSAFYTELIKNVEEEIYNADCRGSVIRYNWREPLVSSIDATELDALLLLPSVSFSPEDIRFVHELDIPIVILGFLMRGFDMDTVGADNEYGGALVANCFLKEGHKKIAALLAEPDNAIFQSRLEGFIKHAHLSGVKEVEIIDTKTISGENSSAKAYSEMSRIFRDGFAFSALFALSDGAALGVLKAAHDNAVKIPEDLSIIGYDDLPEAQFYHPALSSVRQNLRDWGIEALKILKKRWTGYKGPSIQKAMTPELIIRESVYGEKKGMLYAEA